MDRRMQLMDPKVGAVLEGEASVVERTLSTTKAGKPYLRIALRNRSGTIAGKVWEEQLADWNGIERGRGVFATAEVIPGWQGGPVEIDFRSVVGLAKGHAVEREMNPICPTPLAELMERFRSLRREIARPAMALLLDTILEHAGMEAYCTAPAAVSHHHAYIHGLLEHSVEVTELALAIADRPAVRPHVDRDATIVGALLHDVGKTLEYAWEGIPIGIREKGRLVPHVVLGAMIAHCAVRERWSELKAAGGRPLDAQHLCHVIVSHHGVPEWGSPVSPITVEAQIVHQADNASAKVRGLVDVCSSRAAGSNGWIENPGWPHKRPLLYLAQFGGGAEHGSPTDHESSLKGGSTTSSSTANW